jgi:hypothetical protein
MVFYRRLGLLEIYPLTFYFPLNVFALLFVFYRNHFLSRRG